MALKMSKTRNCNIQHNVENVNKRQYALKYESLTNVTALQFILMMFLSSYKKKKQSTFSASLQASQLYNDERNAMYRPNEFILTHNIQTADWTEIITASSLAHWLQ